jgi:hypothetical protein
MQTATLTRERRPAGPAPETRAIMPELEKAPAPEAGTRRPVRFSAVRYQKKDLRPMGVAAVCLDDGLRLWEYAAGSVFMYDRESGRPSAMPFAAAPQGPWRHSRVCDCEVCRLGTA